MSDVLWFLVIGSFVAWAIYKLLKSLHSNPSEPDLEKAWSEAQEDMAAQKRMARKETEARRRDEEE